MRQARDVDCTTSERVFRCNALCHDLQFRDTSLSHDMYSEGCGFPTVRMKHEDYTAYLVPVFVLIHVSE